MTEWQCRQGHTIGHVIEYGAFSCLKLVNERGETIAIISGRADVCCPKCGQIRSWQVTRVSIKYRRVLA